MRNGYVARFLTIGILLTLAACNKTGTSSDSSGSNPSSAAQGSSASNGSASAASSGASASTPAPAPPVEIAAGTGLAVTVDQNISTKTNSSGDSFDASLAEPVTVDGAEVLPKGTHLHGTVTQAASAGHLKGGAVLSLTLDSIKLNGQAYSIRTSTYSEQGKTRGKRTAIGAGGGAAFGAIVGALAGGGKGAAIGAGAGAGAGTAGAAYTGDRDLTIAAETRVHFKLTKSVSISQ
jgi:hypothetical protein